MPKAKTIPDRYSVKVLRYTLNNNGFELMRTVKITGKQFDILKTYRGYDSGFYKYELFFEGKLTRTFYDYSPNII